MIHMSQVIVELDAELPAELQPYAAAWADKHFGGAWTQAIDRFYLALMVADQALLEQELQFYKNEIKNLMRKYKAEKKLSDIECFLSSITPLKMEEFDAEKLKEKPAPGFLDQVSMTQLVEAEQLAFHLGTAHLSGEMYF